MTTKKAAKKTSATKKVAKTTDKSATLRYAHPFFTTTPIAQRPATAYGKRMEDYAVKNLGTIPKPRTNPIMTLADVIGKAASDELAAAGTIRFHAVGDTGRHGGSTQEEDVSHQMAADYKAGASLTNPAFLFHLGDVIYGASKDAGYRDAFYRPFMEYPGKIIAIPGNHDGETFPTTDPKSLRAFRANFCLPTATVPPMAKGVGILRQMIPQPAVYWWLQHDLFDLIALYSNHGEGQGDLTDGKGDDQQITFLTASLKSILAAQKKAGKKKALMIAAHHPAYSNGGHAGSAEMLAQIETACTTVGIVPHIVLAGHAHNYQRYTRTNSVAGQPAETTFLVAGTGGYGLQTVAAATGAPHPAANANAAANPPVYEKAIMAYGYLNLSISASRITAEFWQVPPGAVTPFDSVVIPI